ncbi:MAG: zinc-ribbon domain-containing protein [Burkholderiales bacterium]|nr:zinc-ribbon domain-containing protein [Burkholderiales bacterium]
MALATRCPNCHALFRVAADQLKLRGGLVRCGACRHVFDATGTLSYIDDATLSAPAHAAAPAVGAVIAAIRKAEATASEPHSSHGAATLPHPPGAAPSATDEWITTQAPDTGAPARAEVTPVSEQTAEDAWTTEAPSEEAGGQGETTGTAEFSAERAEAPASPDDYGAADEENHGAEPATPAFLREAETQKRRRRSALYGIGVLLLAALVLAQLAVAFRADLLARFPQGRPALEGLCSVFRCSVNWPARGDLLAVVGSELQALPGSSAFELTAVVRNRGSVTLALPAIELTLTDTLNRTVARRVFAPADYLASERGAQGRLLAGLEPGADLTVRVAFEARGLNAAGFVVYPFYL